MSTPWPSLHASILSRLKNISRERREDMQFTLARYTCERLLYRLSRSQHADSFVLKGAALFATWVDSRYRATRDIDFLVFIEATEQRIADAFRDIFAVTVEPDDGLLFDADSIKVSRIREEFEYGGLHLDAVARLGTTRIPVKVDSGFGDVITPAAVALTYPSMLGFPAATLRGYPKETVAAEKLEAIVRIGMTNSRLWDIWSHSDEDVESWHYCSKAGMLDCYLFHRPPNNGNDCACNPTSHPHCTTPPNQQSCNCD